jgi:hypothetical protein
MVNTVEQMARHRSIFATTPDPQSRWMAGPASKRMLPAVRGNKFTEAHHRQQKFDAAAGMTEASRPRAAVNIPFRLGR